MKNKTPTQSETEGQDLRIRHRKLTDARPIIGDYSYVNEITIKYKIFLDSVEKKIESRNTLKISNKDNFYIFLSCINNTCVRGGFDFTNKTRRAIVHKLPVSKGEMSCNGWSDAEHIDACKCLAKIEYEITVDFRA